MARLVAVLSRILRAIGRTIAGTIRFGAIAAGVRAGGREPQASDYTSAVAGIGLLERGEFPDERDESS